MSERDSRPLLIQNHELEAENAALTKQLSDAMSSVEHYRARCKLAEDYHDEAERENARLRDELVSAEEAHDGSESVGDMLGRLKSMAAGAETWDLSPNDTAAISWMLQQNARLRDEVERQLIAALRALDGAER